MITSRVDRGRPANGVGVNSVKVGQRLVEFDGGGTIGRDGRSEEISVTNFNRVPGEITWRRYGPRVRQRGQGATKRMASEPDVNFGALSILREVIGELFREFAQGVTDRVPWAGSTQLRDVRWVEAFLEPKNSFAVSRKEVCNVSEGNSKVSYPICGSREEQ